MIIVHKNCEVRYRTFSIHCQCQTNKIGMQRNKNAELNDKKTTELSACSRCKAQSVDLTTAYACYNCHYMCNICIQFLAKTDEQLICPKCNHTLENPYNIRKSKKKNRNLPAGERRPKNEWNIAPSKLEQYLAESHYLEESIHKLKQDEMKNTSHSDSDKYWDRRSLKSHKSKSESRFGTSDGEGSLNSQSDSSSNPLVLNCNTIRRYIVPARPVVCPITMCKRNVAATGFISHYEFDHPEVSVLVIAPGEQYTIILNPDQVLDEVVGCVCLFTLTTMGKPHYSSPNTETIGDRDGLKSILVPFTMMIAKLNVTFNHAGAKRDTQSISQQKPPTEDHAFLIIWICGFDLNPEVYYSLEATYNNYRTKAMIYSGPVMSLRQQQDPEEVFNKGDCLILSPGLLSCLCADSGSLDINVTFH